MEIHILQLSMARSHGLLMAIQQVLDIHIHNQHHLQQRQMMR